MAETTFKMVEGVKNIHVAQIKDGAFLTPIRVRGLAEIKISKQYKEGQAVGDMEVMLQKKKLKQLDVSITANELPPNIEAMLQGMEYSKGELVSGVNDNQNPVALLWQEQWSDGSNSYNVIYNVKLSRDSREGKGNSDNIDFTTIALSGVGLKSDITGKFDMTIFDDATDVDKTKIDSFFTEVQMPTVPVVTP